MTTKHRAKPGANTLIVARAINSGCVTVDSIARHARISTEAARNALRTLREAQLIDSTGRRRHFPAVYRLAVAIDVIERTLMRTRPSAKALLDAWPMPVSFPPIVAKPRTVNAEGSWQ